MPRAKSCEVGFTFPRKQQAVGDTNRPRQSLQGWAQVMMSEQGCVQLCSLPTACPGPSHFPSLRSGYPTCKRAAVPHPLRSPHPRAVPWESPLPQSW